MARLTRRLRLWRADQGGVITIFSLFLLVICLMIGGLAIDYGNAIRARTTLQQAADATAHAALVYREFATSDTATTQAVAFAYSDLPAARAGDIVQPADIQFGTWDPATRSFTADPTSRSAVQVNMHESATSGNAIATYLLKLVGFDHWNINVSSVFETYYPACMTEGFVGQVAVDLQSNNNYLNGFCIHSNAAISINSNNYFEAGTAVTMPNPAQIQLPASGFDSNTGLAAALQKDSWNIRILDQIDTIAAGLAAGDSRYLPSYITNSVPNTYTGKKVDSTSFTQGNIYVASCNGSSPLQISNGTVLIGVVLVTNCNLNFGSNVQLHDVAIVDTNTSSKAVTGASGVQVGMNDNCAPGGGASIMTDGGMDFPAALSLYGGQLVAKSDISFSANGNGVQGASVISGGTVSGTSGMTMAYCGTGMEDDFRAEYFRMVQ